MSDTSTEAHRLGYAQGKAAGDAFASEIKEYVQRLEAERDALRAALKSVELEYDPSEYGVNAQTMYGIARAALNEKPRPT